MHCYQFEDRCQLNCPHPHNRCNCGWRWHRWWEEIGCCRIVNNCCCNCCCYDDCYYHAWREIHGRKIWHDYNNYFHTRPATITIGLLRDGEIYRTITIDCNDNGHYRFDHLPVWRDCYTKYDYEIVELTPLGGYQTTYEGNNIINTLGVMNLTGEKVWVDEGPEVSPRAERVTIELYQNGVKIAEKIVDTTGTGDHFAFTFENLPIKDASGNDYVYTVDEKDVPDEYTKKVEGMTVTNSLGIIP